MQNLLDPVVLFFVFGVFAGTVKSNLEIPPAISRFLSLYLLMALGLKGGFALAHSGVTPQVGTSLGGAVALAVVIPLLGYVVLRKLLSVFDAAAVSATYGSVSAVTFVTTVQYLDNQHIPYGGHMAAAMALMESPAIIMAVIFANAARQRHASSVALPKPVPGPTAPAVAAKTMREVLVKILHESVTEGAQLLLLGSLAVGILTGDAGKTAMQPFFGDIFKGMLSIFLLDMGLMAARNLPQVRGKSVWLIAYAVIGPWVHAGIAVVYAWLTHLPYGDATLLMVLAASASYIAVPAALRYAMPEANPSLYLGLSLGITFPMNILVGIPIYSKVAQWVLN